MNTPPLKGRAVEQAAVEWVMEYERRQGRAPIDRRYVRDFPGDIESPPRVIEIKSTATSFRGWFLPLEPIQFEHAQADPDFHLYVVENVGQGDPEEFTLRIVVGEQLRDMTKRSAERHYFEVSWPTRNHDATPVLTMPDEGQVARHETVIRASKPSAAPTGAGKASTADQAIREALESLGGEAQAFEIREWVETRYPGRWISLSTTIADLAHPGSPSSPYPTERRFLERVTAGRYRLRR